MNKRRHQAKIRDRRQAREKARDQLAIDVAFASDWLLKQVTPVFLNQSQNAVQQNLRNSELKLYFRPQRKPVLYLSKRWKFG